MRRDHERFLPGDVFIDADPTLPPPCKCSTSKARTVMLDLAVLAQVATTSPTRAPGSIRFTGYQPVSAAAAEHWRRTVSYLGEMLGNPEAAGQPLIRGHGARLFGGDRADHVPKHRPRRPTAQDRHDAMTATVRRATAFHRTARTC